MSEKIFCEEMEKPELSEDTLAHFGVKGMKWGVQRWLRNRKQNWGKRVDGTGRGTGSAESKARRRKGYTGQVLKYKPKSTSLGNWDSALVNDPRFERKTSGIDTARDKRYQRQGSAINYSMDKRYQRTENGMNVFYDERYHGPYKRWGKK